MSVRQWKHISREHVADMRVFDVTRHVVRNPRNGKDRDIARIETRDWVNVLAVTDDRRVILVEQYRHGVEDVTLEIPGGLVDAGEDPRAAAVRELQEESGYTGATVSDMGVVQPNPAILDNRCFTYLVEGCHLTHELQLDDGEDIVVRTRPLEEIPGLIADGTIQHALVVCGFWWMAAKRPDLLRLS